jgi:ArsR family transcriptional regulator, arsenate/arsenite/antimonite-responsive transcriptional repressor
MPEYLGKPPPWQAAGESPTLLDAFRRLIPRLQVPHNTMSTHLAVLTRASLVGVGREGRMMHYGADLEGFRALIGFLMHDCCNGRAEICARLVAELNCCVAARGAQEAGESRV